MLSDFYVLVSPLFVRLEAFNLFFFPVSGSKFNMTSRITYSPSDGQRQVLRVQMVFKGHHQKNQLLVAIQLDGEMPDMRYDARITFNRYRENFKKIAPGDYDRCKVLMGDSITHGVIIHHYTYTHFCYNNTIIIS